eukprot:TRINITY_DN6080_c0_g2_i2.p1 TRINITY_DN6080_c0_g2~~TRINITY_DN6080_c0_g2_i2.p1  ORF type:complete len:132 (-),score=25.96 TRINITY_DN6080_c0_g2_i2:348-743(-)
MLELMNETDQSVNESIAIYSNIGTPVMIWVRGTTIRWVNQAYKDLTGFNRNLDKEEASQIEEMSDAGLLQSVLAGIKTMLSFGDNEIYNCEMKNHRNIGPEFIPGILSVNHKKKHRWFSARLYWNFCAFAD